MRVTRPPIALESVWIDLGRSGPIELSVSSVFPRQQNPAVTVALVPLIECLCSNDHRTQRMNAMNSHILILAAGAMMFTAPLSGAAQAGRATDLFQADRTRALRARFIPNSR